MAPTKRTPFEREENLPRITELYLRGRTQAQIGAELGLSQGMISNDLKLIQRRWREQTAFNLDEAKAKELAKIDLMERDYQEWKVFYLEAWEASKTERTKARQETGGKGKDGKAVVTKASMEKEQRDGNPAFLDGLIKCNTGIDGCIDRRCKLLGLYAATKSELTGKDGGPIETADVTLTDEERSSRIAAILNAARARRDRQPAEDGQDDLATVAGAAD